MSGWTAGDLQTLPEVVGETYTKKDVLLDGSSFQKCSFNECRLIYRGGPARIVLCYIGPNCSFQFEDAAGFTLQMLQDLGWGITPPKSMDQINPGTSQLEMKQYTVSGKGYTLILKQVWDGSWECAGFDPTGNEVIKAIGRATKRDAQFSAHAALYELHSIRNDQRAETDCEKGWKSARVTHK